MRLVFLGTGASGGTPGRGRSQRRESSLLVEGAVSLLIDVTRDVAEQLRHVRRIDAVALTHAHRDATGGVPQLRQWCRERSMSPVPLFAHAKTLASLERRFPRLDHFQPVAVTPDERVRCGPWQLDAIEVPHAPDPEVPTLAWRIVADDRRVVYASDIAGVGSRLARFAARADVLVIDGATYRRTVYTHLRIDRDLPTVCGWNVRRILLTQIGRSAPPHGELRRLVAQICPRAGPAHDGLVVRL